MFKWNGKKCGVLAGGCQLACFNDYGQWRPGWCVCIQCVCCIMCVRVFTSLNVCTHFLLVVVCV